MSKKWLFRATVYDKDGAQINWLDAWSDLHAMMETAFKNQRVKWVEVVRYEDK